MQHFMLRLDGCRAPALAGALAAWVARCCVAALPFAVAPVRPPHRRRLRRPRLAVEGGRRRARPRLRRRRARDARRGARAASRAATAGGARGARPRRRAAADGGRTSRSTPRRGRGRAAGRRLGRATLVVPLRSTVDEDADRRRHRPARRARRRRRRRATGVAPHLVGQGALWAGLQDVSKERPREGRAHRLPDRAADPARRLRLARRRRAAARARRRVSVLITGALIYSLSLAMDMSVFVTNMASMIGIGVAVDYSLFVLARYREEVRARPRARGARARSRWRRPASRSTFSGLTVMRLARRPVADRHHRAALDGARRDPRRRGLGARGARRCCPC